MKTPVIATTGIESSAALVLSAVLCRRYVPLYAVCDRVLYCRLSVAVLCHFSLRIYSKYGLSFSKAYISTSAVVLAAFRHGF